MIEKPAIAIACNLEHVKDKEHVSVISSYTGALLQAGGAPLVVPITSDEAALEACLGAVRGLLLPGGIDVYPLLYKAQPDPQLGRLIPDLDHFQIRLFHLARKRGMPILGICRGTQVINVAMGGTLIQHIPNDRSALGHLQNMEGRWPSHSASALKGSIVAGLYGENFEVNSFHHQAVDIPAPGMQVTAQAPDGIVEAIESEQGPFLVGVQWHPERMVSEGSPSLKLFQRFVAEAAQYRR